MIRSLSHFLLVGNGKQAERIAAGADGQKQTGGGNFYLPLCLLRQF